MADLVNHTGDVNEVMNFTGPTYVLSQTWSSLFCPATSYPNDGDYVNTILDPNFNVTCRTTTPFLNFNVNPYDRNGGLLSLTVDPAAPSNLTSAISNAMQVVLAAARIDVGNILSNNILVNRDLVSTAIQETLPDPVTGGATGIWSQLTDPGPQRVTINGIVPGAPVTINTTYQCHVQIPKSPGQIFVAVAVATVTLFSSGWAVFMLLLTFFANRKNPRGMFHLSCPLPFN